jgi:hypothetical protein
MIVIVDYKGGKLSSLVKGKNVLISFTGKAKVVRE